MVYLCMDTVIRTLGTLLDFHIAKNTRLVFQPRKDNRLLFMSNLKVNRS